MKKNLQSGFTLIELLVVIAIISILASIIVPKISGGRDSAKLSSAKTTAKSVDNALAVADYNNLAGYWKTSSQSNTGVIPSTIVDIAGVSLTVSAPTKVWSTTNPYGTGSSMQLSSTGYGGASQLTSPTITRASSSTGITMGAWFKITDPTLGWGLTNNSTSGIYPPFWVTDSQMQVYIPGTGNTYHNYTSNIKDNKWHYILAVLKYGQYARVYIDGNIVKETTTVPASASVVNTATGMGPQNNFTATMFPSYSSGPSLDGYIADPVFVNEALY